MKKKVIELTSEFWGIPISKIDDALLLDDANLSNNSSIRFYQFIAAIESNFNVKVVDVNEQIQTISS